jgi:hypothetical protein
VLPGFALFLPPDESLMFDQFGLGEIAPTPAPLA